MAFVEDLSTFFSDFADDGVLAGQPVRGLLNLPVREHGMGLTGGGIVATDPDFLLPSDQVPAAVFGVTLTVAGQSFSVREALPDGNGLTRLYLSNG